MRRNDLVRLALVALALAGLACETLVPGPTLIPAESPSPGEQECSPGRVAVALVDEDDGGTASLSVGDSLAITLGSNPTTGFEWTVLTIDDTWLRFDGKSYEGTGVAVGSGGRESLCFTALAPGHGPLAVIYHRTFETNVPPMRTFLVTVEVK